MKDETPNPFPDPEEVEREFFSRFVDFRGKRVLEIGCGDGRTITYYANEAKWIVGIDNDRDELIAAQKETRAARKDSRFLGESGNLKTDFIHGDAASLPFADSSFDLTILSWSL
ncbi:MAG: class I SAM-dependent methyltransferase [Chloroflexi bacterium]|nr:class I SAM-dependent methyltransferase [Chloroflexota bacterium]